MKIETTSEDIAKMNALNLAFSMEEVTGNGVTKELLKFLKEAIQKDIEIGSIEKSVKQYNEYFK